MGLPKDTKEGKYVFSGTAVKAAQPDARYSVKRINDADNLALHRACASFNPFTTIIHTLVKREGIEGMRRGNAIGITPSQYLEANPFADISEKEIISRFILENMGETV